MAQPVANSRRTWPRHPHSTGRYGPAEPQQPPGAPPATRHQSQRRRQPSRRTRPMQESAQAPTPPTRSRRLPVNPPVNNHPHIPSPIQRHRPPRRQMGNLPREDGPQIVVDLEPHPLLINRWRGTGPHDASGSTSAGSRRCTASVSNHLTVFDLDRISSRATTSTCRTRSGGKCTATGPSTTRSLPTMPTFPIGNYGRKWAAEKRCRNGRLRGATATSSTRPPQR